MVHINKKETINGRPVFSSKKKEMTPGAFLEKNSRFRQLDPSNKPSKVTHFLKQKWAQIKPYFSMQKPDPVQENKGAIARPKMKGSTPIEFLSPKNLDVPIESYFHAYRSFLKDDNDCPEFAIKAFKKLEKDKKTIQKLTLDGVIEKKNGFITRTCYELENLKPGQTRLLPLKGDQSLILSITRSSTGKYNIQIIGSEKEMKALGAKELSIGGKQKIISAFKFNEISSVDFKSLIPGLLEKNGMSPTIVQNHMKAWKEFSSLPTFEDYSATSNRADKIFWTIMEGFNSEDQDSQSKMRALRLRTELLILYEFFQQERLHLDPTTKEYRELKKLFQDVSAKVLIASKKGQLHTHALSEINQSLKTIDLALQEAEKKSGKILSGSLFTKGHTFKNQGVKEKFLKRCQRTHGVQSLMPPRKEDAKLSQKPIRVDKIAPFGLTLYESIDTPEKFMQNLNHFTQLSSDLMASPQEKRQLEKNVFRFFSEVPFNLGDNEMGHFKKNEDSFLWMLDNPTLKIAMDQMVEIMEAIAIQKRPESLTQYDVESIEKMIDFMDFFYFRLTDSAEVLAQNELSRIHRYQYSKNQSFRRGLQQASLPLLTSTASPIKRRKKTLRIPLTDKALVFNSNNFLADFKTEALPELHRFMIATQKIFGDEEGNYSLFGKTYFIGLNYTDLMIKGDKNKWIRSIENPYLIALFTRAITQIDGGGSLVPNVPEAFHSNPEGLLDYYFQEAKEEILNNDFSFNPLSQETIKALSRLLRYESPHNELIAFIYEYRDLMLDPEIRNFVDAIYFGSKLDVSTQIDYQDVVQEEIAKLETSLKEEIEKKNPDSNRLKEQFDLYLYYHEWLLKLQISLPDSPVINLDQLNAFIQLQDKKGGYIFQDAQGYAARIFLRKELNQLNKGIVNHQNLPEILRLFMDVSALPMNLKNVDPYFEHQLDRHWEAIARHIEKNPLSNEAYNQLINRFLFQKNIDASGINWEHQGNLVFQNGTLEVNLMTREVSKIGSQQMHGYLPANIQTDVHIRAALKHVDLAKLQTFRQEINGIEIYSFQDEQGICYRIEQGNNQKCRLYRSAKIRGEEVWLQSAPIHDNESPADLAKLFKPEKKASLQSIFGSGLFIDPERSHKGYVFNKSGGIDFEMKIQHSKKGLEVQSLNDYREVPHLHSLKITSLSVSKNPSLDFLKNFESSNEILLWSKKGALKKVELPRYNLSFIAEKGRLKCITEPYSGYFVNPSASEKDKHGMRFSLLLEHADPKKGKKLLVADSRVIQISEQPILPKAKGLAKLQLLSLFKKTMKEAKKGIFPDLVMRDEIKIDSKDSGLNFTAFTMRGKTDEIVKGTKGWAKDLFELICQGTLTDQPIAVHHFLSEFPFKDVSKDQKLFNQIILFCEEELGGSPSESAIKFKMAMELYQTLERENKLSVSIKNRLQGIIMQKGIEQLAVGRRIPEIFALSSDERTLLADLLKKNNPQFFDAHMAVYFLKDGNSFDLDKGVSINKTTWARDVKKWKQQLKEENYDNRVKKIESKIHFDTPLTQDQMKASLPLLHENRPTLLFTPKEMEKLFHSQDVELERIVLDPAKATLSCEKAGLTSFQNDLDHYQRQPRKTYLLKANKKSLDRFIKNEVIPKLTAYENESLRLESKIQARLKQDSNQERQIAIYSGAICPPSLDELRIALVQNRLNVMSNLPSDINRAELKADLIAYYDALARKNAVDAACYLLEEINTKHAIDPNQKEIYSNALYKLLTLERFYDVEKDPRLLVFEAQMFINFRKLEGGVNQLELLEALLQNPHSIVQAPTGVGKTSVFSIYGSLAKANGENLVVQKVLAPLFEQTLDQMDDALGGLFGSLVCPVRFNLKMRLTKHEIQIVNEKEETKEVSIFKEMYENLATVIDARGCVLTDYTSFPLLEEKFFKLGADMEEEMLKGGAISEISKEHYIYLRKILLLLGNKSLDNMDEFDVQNRPIQKLQLSFGPGSDVPAFFFDTSLEIYKILSEDKTLQLQKNIQGDLTEEMRAKILASAAKTMAKKIAADVGDPSLERSLSDYFLGKDERVLKRLPKDLSLLDKVALCKDQFSIYLPLTLSHNRGSKYARANDGSKTVPCRSGEKREAKPGTLLEDINYTIQDYLQSGITVYDLSVWRQDFESDFKTNPAVQKQFAPLFMRSPQELSELFKSKEGMAELVNEINQDVDKVTVFLEMRLRKMKTSGTVITMDPGNCVDMSFAVSGISATSGAKESLHSQFKPDDVANGQVRAEMAYRISKRAKNQNVIVYDPANPEEILAKADQEVRAVIDGADAFKNHPEIAAKILMQQNTQLKGVEYRDESGSRAWEGTATRKLNEKGYVFAESETVGTDRPLAPNAKGIVTLNEKHGMGAYSQIEGRLRLPGQTAELAMSQYIGIKTVPEAMSHAVCVDARTEAADIYRRKKQELTGIVRKEMKKKLFTCETPEEFLKLYRNEDCRKLFITAAEPSYQKAGEYFTARKRIEVKNSTPEIELKLLKAKCRAQAEKLGLKEAISQLDKIEYNKELLEKMFPHVSGSSQELGMELQMDEDLDIEQNTELALHLQTETQQEQMQASSRTDILYPRRNYIMELHKFMYNIYFTDNYFPVSRAGSASIFERKLFDSETYRIAEVGFRIEDGQREWVVEDPMGFTNRYRSSFDFIYDIRTGRFLSFKYPLTPVHSDSLPFTDLLDPLVPQEPLLPPDFNRVIAQIKFFDGRTSGYTKEEVDELKIWLKAEGPDLMKKNLMNVILCYRYKDRLCFSGSQLEQIFNELS